jgi:chitinase
MMKKVINNSILLLIGLVFSTHLFGQLPNPAMVGYWENWQGNRFVELKNIDSRYNVIQISFATGQNGKDYDLGFTPAYDEAEFRADVKALQDEGKKVLISLGGQNDQIMLDSLPEKELFVSSITHIIDTWGFDGLDIDLEGSSLSFNDIKVENSGDIRIQYMIDGISEIMANHYATHGKKLLLTMAPETNYVQGGLSNWSVNNSHGGAYLPIIEALSDSIDMLNVQLYNSGSQYGLNGTIYNQGTADWILAMTEVVIRGFEGVNGLGLYSGLPAKKVGVALPGCHSYDAVPHDEMEAAMRYLIGEGPKPGSYRLLEPDGYPDLRGMMTWSINSDRKCGPAYGFVDTWSKVFTDMPYIEIKNKEDIFELQENGGIIEVVLFNDIFEESLNSLSWEIKNLPEGVDVDRIQRINDTIAEIVLKGNSIDVYTHSYFNVSVNIDSSELVSSNKDLFRNKGVLLKPNRSIIPGKVQLEKFVKHKGATIGNISNEDGGGKFARTNYNSWIEVEVEVTKEEVYNVDFRYRTGKGSHKVAFKVNGITKKTHKISSSTEWTVWENSSFKIKLTEGKHTLKFHLTEGWAIFDYVNFYSSLGEETITHLGQNFFYPNPASDNILFKNITEGQLRIFDVSGKLIKEVLLDNSNQINISDLKTGIYTIQLENSNGIFIHDKLIKK